MAAMCPSSISSASRATCCLNQGECWNESSLRPSENIIADRAEHPVEGIWLWGTLASFGDEFREGGEAGFGVGFFLVGAGDGDRTSLETARLIGGSKRFLAQKLEGDRFKMGIAVNEGQTME